MLTDRYPNIKIALGNLDSLAVLKTESVAADIVVHAADADHFASAEAIISALAASQKPSFLIHTSGTAVLYDTAAPQTLGRAVTPDKRYNDVTDLSAITSFPATHIHRTVDALVLAAPACVRTAIVCPPAVYGAGSGPGNTTAQQIPMLVAATAARGRAFVVRDGANSASFVHACDLGRAYLALVEAAARGGQGADWDALGYYFVDGVEAAWKDVVVAVAAEMKKNGIALEDGIDSVTPEEADELCPYGAFIFGVNMHGHGERARKVLGWVPQEAGLFESIAEPVRLEAEKLRAGKVAA